MKPNTYSAKLFEVPIPKGVFKIAGTLDGYVDLFCPGVETYQLSIDEASQLAAALNGAVEDIRQNCLYDADALLDKES